MYMYCWSGVNQRNCYTSFISWPLRFVTKNLFIYNLTPSSAAQVIYNLLTFRPFYILEWFTGFFNPGPRYILYCKAALLQYYRVLISRRERFSYLLSISEIFVNLQYFLHHGVFFGSTEETDHCSCWHGRFCRWELLVQVSYLYGRGKREVCVEGGVLNNYRDSNLIRRRIRL